jgi:hypothetical protein
LRFLFREDRKVPLELPALPDRKAPRVNLVNQEPLVLTGHPEHKAPVGHKVFKGKQVHPDLLAPQGSSG